MNQIASGLPHLKDSKIPVINTEAPEALEKIKADLSGDALGVLPSALKRNASYRKGFEQAAANTEKE